MKKRGKKKDKFDVHKQYDETILPKPIYDDPESAIQKLDKSTMELPEDWNELTAVQRREHIQDKLMQRSSDILEAALAFSEIDPEDESPPPEWIEALGREQAMKKFRVAKSAWANSKAAPFGISVAKSLFAAITKIDAARAQPTTPLNAAVQINVNVPEFEVIDVD